MNLLIFCRSDQLQQRLWRRQLWEVWLIQLKYMKLYSSWNPWHFIPVLEIYVWHNIPVLEISLQSYDFALRYPSHQLRGVEDDVVSKWTMSL